MILKRDYCLKIVIQFFSYTVVLKVTTMDFATGLSGHFFTMFLYTQYIARIYGRLMSESMRLLLMRLLRLPKMAILSGYTIII